LRSRGARISRQVYAAHSPADPDRVFELRSGRVFVQPGSLEPSAPGGGKFGLGILQRSDEAVERTGAVLDAMEPPKPLIAGKTEERADKDLALLHLETVRAVVGFVAELEHQCFRAEMVGAHTRPAITEPASTKESPGFFVQG
jgi:hypothetical protein